MRGGEETLTQSRTTLTLEEFFAACAVVAQTPNAEQRDAISAPAREDLHLVAGPGTGKTSSLVLRILKCILVDGLRPGGIVAATFTVKAAAELRSRLLTRGFALIEHLSSLSDLPAGVRRRVARLDVNQVTTNTVDGLCQQVLRDHREAGTHPPVIVDEFVAKTLMLRAGLFEDRRFQDDDLDAFLLAFRDNRRFGWNIGAKTEMLRTLWDRRFQDQVDWGRFTAAEAPQVFTDALAAYEGELVQRHMVDFAMLEETVLRQLRAGMLRTFVGGLQAIFVDEYQDTNLLQESLYFALASASGAGLTIVGDDDQSLYRFRGATVELFRDFPERCEVELMRPRPRTVFLRRNYRSTPAIVSFVNSFAGLDPAYQSARVAGKPPLLARNGADAHFGPPVLGMFRPNAEALACALAGFISDVFQGSGYVLPGGDCIRAATPNGVIGDAALLCGSPVEATRDRVRLPGLLRAELADLPTPIEIFNPRGEDISQHPLVASFGGLLLSMIDPSTDIEVASGGRLPPDARSAFMNWRAAADDRLIADTALRSYHTALAQRRARRGGAWPRSWPMLKVVYGLAHFFPDLHDDPEGQVYLEVFTRQLAACAAISRYRGDLLAPPAEDHMIVAAAKELLCDFLAPIATGATGVNEELVETFPRNRLAVLSVHQAKGLEFPLTIVDVGADFRREHAASAFKRYPSDGGLAHRLEDRLRPYSPLAAPTRSGRDRAFDDLQRQFFVAYSRPETVLLLVGLDGVRPGGIKTVATGAARAGAAGWSNEPPYLEI